MQPLKAEPFPSVQQGKLDRNKRQRLHSHRTAGLETIQPSGPAQSRGGHRKLLRISSGQVLVISQMEILQFPWQPIPVLDHPYRHPSGNTGNV